MKKQVLITGFEAFGGAPTNPSADLAVRLDGARLHGRVGVGAILPVAFGGAGQALRSSIRKYDPELVVCLGLAAGRSQLSLERVAVNIDDARIPDNAGNQPVDAPIRRSGPAAYFSSLPIKAMHRALARHDWPVEVSNTAGTYVCNHVFYCLMHALRRRPRVRGGFVHVPTPGNAFGLDAMEAALKLAISTALRVHRDIPVSAGRED
jgi:pyroglutamyl-peptidase